VIVIRSFLEDLRMAGPRLGYAISDPEVARLLDPVQEPFNVNRAALAAGLAGVSATSCWSSSARTTRP
jgi:histidinol-phosphate aminotransferase